ncbi:ABC transporter ATP-binding protein [Rhodoligotrophos ferricapiens]|uniref:ABC transporter ATP-binding protein n=1 Tax=Rhodoligotrophos ferricapiens TaxID=3069264 RepID=UPI00315DA011
MSRSVDIREALSGSSLRIERVAHDFGGMRVLNDISTEIASGEFLTLLGASGSGKTTLLRIIGGLITPKHGRIYLGERDITHFPPERRDIGFVFQNYALFPHLTVAENVGFALSVRKVRQGEVASRVREVLELVGLGDLGGRYPGQLSGGQQQRVALARAIVFRPAMLLLDEPLGALDRQLRQQLAVELRNLQRRSGITMIYVTHDQEEAFTMSTQVAIMHNGTIRQMAPPALLYRQPVDLMVARFVGELNAFAGTIRCSDAQHTVIDSAMGTLTAHNPHWLPGTAVTWAVRPEHVILRPRQNERQASINVINARVRTVIFGGSWHRIDYELPSGMSVRAEGRGEPDGVNEGDEVDIGIDPERIMIFNET